MKVEVDSQLQSAQLHEQQQEHLDATDAYASIWQDVVHQVTVNEANRSSKTAFPSVKWGGRGKGGRGIARRTLQPYDIILPDGVQLQYVGQVLANASNSSGTIKSSCLLLLDDARINFLSGHVYGMVGPNGCGKSSLLRRIDSCKLPGFPIHITTLLISSPATSQSLVYGDDNIQSNAVKMTTTQYLIQRFRSYCQDRVQVVNRLQIHQLEEAIQSMDILSQEDAMHKCMDSIASYEDFIDDIDEFTISENMDEIECYVSEVLEWMGISAPLHHVPIAMLTIGQQAKVELSLVLLCCTLCYCDLLLLDEITSSLDIAGLIQLRRLVQFLSSTEFSHLEVGPNFNARVIQSNEGSRRPTTIVLVSHDYDFLNDVVTNVVEFGIDKKLRYFNGGYNQYITQRHQIEQHQIHQLDTLKQKQAMMQKTLDNIRNQPVHTSRGAKKKAKTINCQKKKMDRIFHSDNSLNDVLQNSEQLKRALFLKKYEHELDKSIHFQFRKCLTHWNEPLIVASDVGHSFETIANVPCASSNHLITMKKDGFLFDGLDFCINEGGTYCIMGECASGKSSLLKILAKNLNPTEGNAYHALNLSVKYIDFSPCICKEDSIIRKSALVYLMDKYPTKTEQEIRSELVAFGLGPVQAQTQLSFLSAGEQSRFQLASAMLQCSPQVLLLDNPTANLDVDSVDALIYGLRKWNGTLVMVSHDAYFIRSLEAQCYVLIESEGKLRRVLGGVNEYIQSFGVKRK